MVGVSPDCCGNQGQVPPHLWLSTDGTHWRDITPSAMTRPGKVGSYPMFESASFLSSTIGWVTTYDPATVQVTIYRTADGGRTWSSIPGGEHTANAGAITRVQLLTPTTVFLDTVQPTGPSAKLQVSTDAGASWRTVYFGPRVPSPVSLQVLEFTSRSRGFAAGGIPPADPLTGPNTAGLETTTDAGATWSRLRLPLPWSAPTCPTEATDTWCWTGLPVLFDARTGVVASERIHASTATVAFDATSDGGSTWGPAASLSVPIPPNQTTQPPTPVPFPPTPSAALVATPGGHAWWVLSQVAGSVTTKVSTDTGRHWVTGVSATPKGVPDALNALDASRALLTSTVTTASGNEITAVWLTTDAGHTWHRLFG